MHDTVSLLCFATKNWILIGPVKRFISAASYINGYLTQLLPVAFLCVDDNELDLPY